MNRRPAEAWLTTLLRCGVHAVAALVVVFPLSVFESALAAGLGAAIGAFAARWLARSALRSLALWLLAGVAFLMLLTLRGLFVDSAMGAAWLGPSLALRVADLVFYGLGAFVISLLLRTESIRRRFLALLEVAVIATGFATLLVAHRNGAIHRPYAIADPMFEAGEDPALAILAIGALGAATIGVLLLSERSLLRSFLHVGLLAALLIALVGTTTMLGLPAPEPGADSLGLRDDEGRGRGGGQGGGGRRRNDELEFRDNYQSSANQAPVAVVLLHDDYSPPGGVYYFRQSAFSQYNGRRMISTTRVGTDRDLASGFPAGGRVWVTPAVPSAGQRKDADLGFRLHRYDGHLDDAHLDDAHLDDAHLDDAQLDDGDSDAGEGSDTSPAERKASERRALAITADVAEQVCPVPVALAALGRLLGRRPNRRQVELFWERTRCGSANESYDRRAVESTVALLADHARPFGLEAPTWFESAPNPNPSRFRRAFRVHSEVLDVDFPSLLGRSPGSPSWTQDDWEHYTSLPSDPRYAELANRVVDPLPAALADDPMAQALAVTQYLGRHGTYSLRSRHAGASDPTADFLFGDLTGYCVHFAHAATYLLRSLGLPARVATGYAVSEAGRRGGSAILLRGADSHAWPEVFIEGAGWVVVDVTPERVLDPPPSPADPQLQRLLGEMARGQNALRADGPPPRPLSTWVREARTPVLRGGLGLFALLVLLGYAIKGWRRFSPRWVRGRARSRLIYRAALDQLSEDGLRRRWGESRETFAARVADQVPSLSSLTRRHLRSAFGRPDARSGAEAEAMGRARGQLSRELGRAVPMWRRAAGALNPWSWLWTR